MVLATVVMVATALTACGGNGKSGSATDKKDTNGDGEVKVRAKSWHCIYD